MEQINLPEFLLLFGCTSIDDCWLSTDCIIDESGIKAKHSDWDTINQAMYLQKLRIDFPCTARQLFAWAKHLDKWEADYHNAEIQGHFIEKLPKDFIEKWQTENTLLESWCFESGYMGAVIKEKIGTAPFGVDWTHWLTLSKWTKEQAALLVCGLEPNQFHQVETHADYQSMCKPLVMLLQRIPDDLPQNPFDWLNWFNENGYLDYAPKPLQVWFEQQSGISALQAEAMRDDGAGGQGDDETQNNRLSRMLQERLNKIRNFMSILTEAAKTKGIEFDPMQLQLTKVQLLSELKSRYKGFNIKIDAFELVWTEATKAGICASSTANTKNGKTFLNSIFG